MDKYTIVENLAKEKFVEEMVANIAHRPLDADLCDLSQIVYLALLEYDDGKILDLWENGQMSFFVARIIINQYRTDHSTFRDAFYKYSHRCTDIGGKDWIDDNGD